MKHAHGFHDWAGCSEVSLKATGLQLHSLIGVGMHSLVLKPCCHTHGIWVGNFTSWHLFRLWWRLRSVSSILSQTYLYKAAIWMIVRDNWELILISCSRLIWGEGLASESRSRIVLCIVICGLYLSFKCCDLWSIPILVLFSVPCHVSSMSYWHTCISWYMCWTDVCTLTIVAPTQGVNWTCMCSDSNSTCIGHLISYVYRYDMFQLSPSWCNRLVRMYFNLQFVTQLLVSSFVSFQ